MALRPDLERSPNSNPDLPEIAPTDDERLSQSEKYPKYLQDLQHEPSPSSSLPVQNSSVLGFPRRTFWVLIALALLVVAAAVGGGVGGSLAVQNSKSKSSNDSPPATVTVTSFATQASACASSTASATTAENLGDIYSPKAPSEVAQLNKSCPSSPEIISSKGTMKIECETDTDCYGDVLFAFLSYTLESCVMSCYIYKSRDNTTCLGVAFSSRMKEKYDEDGANCFLMSTIEKRTGPDWTTVKLITET